MEIDTIIKNLKEMLVLRGDNIDEFEEHEVDINRDDFYNNKELIEFNTDNTTLIFALSKTLKSLVIDNLTENENNIDNIFNKFNKKNNIILIFNNESLSSTIVSKLNKFDRIYQKSKGGMIQYFQINQLLFNPTKHILVPEHRKLSAIEVNELMDKYLIKNKLQMPIIMHNDVIAKWIGLKQGDIVEIKRYNENSGLSYYYRYCI